MKKYISILTLTAMLTASAHADTYFEAGEAYDSCQSTRNYSPVLIIGAVTVAAVIAVVVQNRSHGHSHGNPSSESSSSSGFNAHG